MIVIIGAGFAGLCMAIRLKQSGNNNFVVLEKAADLGGVWRDNTYPGAGCDVPSHLYSYSFAQRGDWSRSFPRRQEIHDYLRLCADRFGVAPHIRFNAEVTNAAYENGRWLVTSANGRTYEATSLVSGVGQLNRPRYPDVPGVGEFGGVEFHSARWRHDHDLSGRTVAVIGTGPSAVQFIPEIVPRVKKLIVFQRSANWVVPKADKAYSNVSRRATTALPPIRLARRFSTWWLQGEILLYGALRGNAVGKLVAKKARGQLTAQIRDLELREKLKPDFPIGCKRILISDDFYPALARDNVELVTSAVQEVTAAGVRTADGVTHEADTLIYGTGFLATEFLQPIDIRGRDGVALHDVWKDGAAAYLGITVPDFPGLFLLYGPGTNLGHNSIVYMIEQQVDYILRNLNSPEPTRDEFELYQKELAEELSKTTLEADCTSWYKNADGKVTTNWPKRTFAYRRTLRRA